MKLEFWALAYKYQEDCFFDDAEKETVLELESTCLYPTEERAKQVLEDELCDDFVPVKVTIASHRQGVTTFETETQAVWPEEHEDEE